MKHLKSINEYSSAPIEMSKDELGMGIQKGDVLVINTDLHSARSGPDKYYFDHAEGNKIFVADLNFGDDDDLVELNLDELGSEWALLSINGQDIIVESKK